MPTLDLVIRGATVYDGTGTPPREVDLGIQGDRLAAIGPHLSGQSVLDARGLAAAPGFIDCHSHSDLALLAAPILEPKLRQGITLELLGAAGVGVAPLHAREEGGASALRRTSLSGLLTDPEIPWGWRSVGEYLAALRVSKPAQDVAYVVPHGALREAILGLDPRKPTTEELQRMRALLAVGLEEGAWGFSTGLTYPPCCFSDAEELSTLGLVAGAKQVPLIVTLRSDGDHILEAIAECGDIGRGGSVRVHLAGLKVTGCRNWERLGAVLEALEAVRERGVHLSADLTPYIASSTLLSALLPPGVLAGGCEAALARIASPGGRRRIIDELLSDSRRDWDNTWRSAGPGGIFLSEIRAEHFSELVGKSLAEAAGLVGIAPEELLLDLLEAESLGGTVLVFDQSEAVVDRLLRLPYVAVATHGMLGGKVHPRSHGAFPRVLARFAREKNSISLAQAVRKLSGLPADIFNLRDHGYLEEGRRANVVLFDPERVDDLATFDAPEQAPSGISHVIVGGKLVIRDGELTGQRPGIVVRR